MSGNTSETRCKHERKEYISGNTYCKDCKIWINAGHPPDGEADKIADTYEEGDENPNNVRPAPEGEAVPEQEGDFHSGGCNDKCSPPYGHYYPAAPVVSTAAPEPPLRISFDIGGVLSKYPEVFRPMIDALQKGGAEVFVITDMHEHDKSVRFVRGNGYDIPSERILNSDYMAHGEACKAETIRQHGIKIHLDDFAGYCAHTECVSLFVWPNPLKPYYADDFKTDGTEGDFGRRKAAKI